MKEKSIKTSALADCYSRIAEKTKNTEMFNYEISANDLIHEDNCPLCGKSDSELISGLYLESGETIQETSVCAGCLFVFRSTSPSYKWFKECWSKISNGKLEVFNPNVEEKRKSRYEEYLSWISHYKQDGKLIDIGSAYGTGAKVFRDAGYNVSSLEPENDRANYIRKKLKINCFDTPIQEFSGGDRNWDIVILAHCLEHLDNPSLVLENIASWMSKGAILYIEVPNIWKFVDWNDSLFLAHKCNFDAENLRWALENTGFSILEKFTINDIEESGEAVGFLAKLADKKQIEQPLPKRKNTETVEKIKQLYRPNFSKASDIDEHEAHYYFVPNINNFYHTVKRDLGYFTTLNQGTNRIVFKQHADDNKI